MATKRSIFEDVGDTPKQTAAPGGIDKGHVDAKTRQQVLDDIQTGTEERPGRHHMVTGFEL